MLKPFPTPLSQRYPHLQQNTHHFVQSPAARPTLPICTFPACQLVYISTYGLSTGTSQSPSGNRRTIQLATGHSFTHHPSRSLMTTTFLTEERLSETRGSRGRPSLPNKLAGPSSPDPTGGNTRLSIAESEVVDDASWPFRRLPLGKRSWGPRKRREPPSAGAGDGSRGCGLG